MTPKFYLLCLSFMSLITVFSCKNEKNMQIGNIMEPTLKAVEQKIKTKYPNARDISTHLTQVARFWTAADGTEDDFSNFCVENYLATDTDRTQAMEKIAKNFEIIYGYFNRITIGLKEPLHLDMGPITSIDNLFGGYDVSSHISEDFFNNRIAFYILLNFRFYTLEQKNGIRKGLEP